MAYFSNKIYILTIYNIIDNIINELQVLFNMQIKISMI